MIYKHIKYTDEHKKEIEEVYKGLGEEAEYIGDEGNMTCRATTKRGALIKFKRRTRDDVGDEEADEIKIDEIGAGFLHLCTEKQKEEMDGSDWYVSYVSENTSDYEVFVYSV